MTHYFVTGATGFVGSRLVDELIADGYQVTGLARSEASEQKLKAKGASAIRGDITDHNALREGAKKADGVIHLAFIHEFDRYDEVARLDQEAVKVILEELKGTNKPFVGISTLLIFNGLKPDNGIYYSEDIRIPLGNESNIRSDTENIALGYNSQGVRVSIVRFPPAVHGPDDQAFVPELIRQAKKSGISYYPDAGDNYWATTHVKDTAHLVRLAADKGQGVYHAAAESISTKQIASYIADTFKLKLESVPSADAGSKLGFIGYFLSLNGPASSDKTKKELGWAPTHATLEEDINNIYSKY